MTAPSRSAAAAIDINGGNYPFRTSSDLSSVLASVQATHGAAARALASAVGAQCGVPVSVFTRSDGGHWQSVSRPPQLPDGGKPVTVRGDRGTPAHRSEAGLVLASRGVAIVFHGHCDLTPTIRQQLTQACVWLSLHRERTLARDRVDEAGEEIAVLRAVTDQLLSVRDLDQVLLSITDRTLQLLESDICGVFLREGDELRMQSCAGHRIIDTARLRMARGQGLAGRVFLTGQPAKVDDYLIDRTISSDFMSLAEQEQCQSALAVPLRMEGSLIGVLEVWRRRPSIFTDDDVRRLVSLADFATIAILNARLYDEQACSVAALQEARDALEGQVEVLRRSAALQRTLLTGVLEGFGVSAIARVVDRELDCEVAIYNPEGQRIASGATRSAHEELPESLLPASRSGPVELSLTDGRAVSAWVHPVMSGGDQVGAVCLLSRGESEQVMEMASVQAAMACSLAHLQQRAASRARAEALEQVLWDLLQGPSEHRIAARSRAQQMGVSLTGPHRVLYGRLENVEDLASEHDWDTSQTDRLRRDVLRTLQRCNSSPRLTLVALRGDWVVTVIPVRNGSVVRETVDIVTSVVRGVQPGLSLTWGVSRIHEDPFELPIAFDEAKTALSAAHRLGSESVFLYEELGIVRLLLGSGKDPDLQAFIREVTGPLIDYDREHDGALIRTLRTFFDADCSQKVAAQRLFVHHKTLRYRLEQIKQLTGLDLARHDDRMRADLALRLLQVSEPSDRETPLPGAV